MTKRFLLQLGLLGLAALACLGFATPASASQAWRVDSLSSSTVAPGGTLEYLVQFTNVGDADMDGTPIEVTATLPPGLRAVKGRLVLDTELSEENFVECTAGDGVAPVGDPSDPTHVKCVNETPVPSAFNHGGISFQLLHLTVAADPGAPEGEQLKSGFAVAGGGAAPASTVDPLRISSAPPTFGLDAFDMQVADAVGSPFTQAGGHPASITTSFDLNTFTDPVPLGGTGRPVEPLKDVFVNLPPGLVGNPTVVDQCTIGQLAFSKNGLSNKTLCPAAAQVGTVSLRMDTRPLGPPVVGPFPIFSMTPPPGAPARFGFLVAGTIVTLDATLRSDGDYGLSIDAKNASELLPIAGATTTFWGTPADHSHDAERACPESEDPYAGGPTCVTGTSPRPFLRLPTACSGAGLPTTIQADSWLNPGAFASAGSRSHLAPGYPAPPSEWGPEVGTTGCGQVPFHPSLEASPTTTTAGSPSGLDVHLRVPQECWEHREEVCSSDLRDAAIALPQGMTLNPSAASGLGACTAAQIGLTTPVGQSAPIHFDQSPVSCPDSSKIGNVTITTPLLKEPLTGAAYLAKQSENPFGSLLAMYLVAEGSGVVIKQAGEIVTDPTTGRITTVFKDAPQEPFSDLHVSLYGGDRAPLRTPPRCGTFAIGGELTPWSGNAPVAVASAFEIEQCGTAGSFGPKLSAGTENPLAGQTSPFVLRLTRQDSEQEFASLTLHEPAGLSGYLKGIPYCPDSALAAVSGQLGTGVVQEQHPSCPAASRVGTLTVGAGAGPNPFYTSSGRVYLAGPYKGAPLSIAVIAPAVAGPFDLGSVVVRNAVHVDPVTAQLTVTSDPLPTVLHGIALDLRDIRIELDRDHFVLNPTSCEEMQFTSKITSTEGASADPSERFQVAGCEKLGFKPKLSLRLRGGTKRSRHPGLTAVLEPKVGNANASSIQVALPHSEFLAQSHIRTICTRVQFAADACPAGSVYGTVTATTPILDQPLSGDVYLRSSDNPLPDMVLKLKGPASQPIEIDAVGRIDSHKGGIRTTFAQVPDAPLTKVVLRLPAGKKSLLENSTNICRGDHRATVQMDGHNGKLAGFQPKLQVKCGKGGAHRHRRHRRS